MSLRLTWGLGVVVCATTSRFVHIVIFKKLVLSNLRITDYYLVKVNVSQNKTKVMKLRKQLLAKSGGGMNGWDVSLDEGKSN